MKRIDAEQLERLHAEQDAVVIDVLPEESFETRHIPGAINVPVGAAGFEQRVEQEVPDKTTPVIVYCADEACQASPEAARKLDDLGYENVHDFEGGLKDWRKSGRGLTGEPKRLETR